MPPHAHNHSNSVSQNHKAQLANAYNELGKELSSSKLRVVGNYTLGKVIGEGTYGKVRLGTHRLTSTRVAIKQIPKAMSATLTREIHHHRRLHHPHVTQLYEVIATESYIWLVTELCSGGELFDYLAEKGRLSETETRSIFGQLCLSVAYIHEKGIVHRDLKLENVLLDERCRIKLGDFGFTREFEKGMMLETFCGTTGYASPEMLQGRKYLGPEVDVWSLGIIFYCLLTGTLPFDDDDEPRMREKIIIGTYEDPEWLSEDARDLIRNILQQDPAKRLPIAQILTHSWFTSPSQNESSPDLPLPSNQLRIKPPELSPISPVMPSDSVSSATSESSFHSASSEFLNSAPTTPDNSQEASVLHHNASESTLKKVSAHSSEITDGISTRISRVDKVHKPETVVEEENLQAYVSGAALSREPSPSSRPPNQRGSSPASSRPPSSFPARTPVRTKRRSVSSVLSQPSSPTAEAPATLPPQDFASLLTKPAPLLFSTPLERSLLNSLSSLGFDTGQMVHSVLSDACDASGSAWWMLKRKAEKRAMDETLKKASAGEGTPAEIDVDAEPEKKTPLTPVEPPYFQPPRDRTMVLNAARSAPELAFVPPTPTLPPLPPAQRPITPPRSKSPRSLLSPTPTTSDSVLQKSTPSTPGGSLREKEKDGSRGKRDGKQRSGSVSIMQRATTALEAAGIVRKKSAEVVREDKERREEKEEKDKHASVGNWLTRSPPMRAVKDAVLPSTPEHELTSSSLPTSSPWVVPSSASSSYPATVTPADSPGDTLTSLPSFESSNKLSGPGRNRGSILSTFQRWFHEDRKGKRKAVAPIAPHYDQTVNTPTTPATARSHRGTTKRRDDNVGGKFARRTAKRPSASSRRSSSVNSRRSSIASMHIPIAESPLYSVDEIPDISRRKSNASHRSITPNSERGEYSSRPSSMHSATMYIRHKKSPSTSSAGSAAQRGRNASPLQKYHRRAGSGSSTRVVRQSKPMPGNPPRPWHVRSNSTTSSLHSLHSSRPGSFYDASEGEGTRTGSPMQSPHTRRSLDETPRRSTFNTVLVAQKKQTPFMSPSATSYTSSFGRTSWKKAWGTEPPGWQSRTTQLPVEVLVISQSADLQTSIRDVFSGRPSTNLGDDDDWVDEEDDVPAFAGGLGQGPISSSSAVSHATPETPMMLSPPPRSNGGRGSRKAGRSSDNGLAPPASSSGRAGGRSKPGHSPVAGNSPLPSDTFEGPPGSGRRQLPTGRSGPAFRQPIQEEDEGEE